MHFLDVLFPLSPQPSMSPLLVEVVVTSPSTAGWLAAAPSPAASSSAAVCLLALAAAACLWLLQYCLPIGYC